MKWDANTKQALRELIAAQLTYSQCAAVFKVTRNSIAGAVYKYVHGNTLNLRARNPGVGRGKGKREKAAWDSRLVETWEERKARRQKERDR